MLEVGLRALGEVRVGDAVTVHELRPGLVITQLYSVGVLTLVITLVSGMFVGMVLGLQGYNTLVDFGAEESLGVMVALSLVRDIVDSLRPKAEASEQEAKRESVGAMMAGSRLEGSET